MENKDKKKAESPVVKFMPLILVAAVLGYAALAYLLLFMPKVGKFIQGGEYDMGPLEVRIENDERYIKRLDKALSEYRGINDAHKNKLDLILPPTEDVPGLFVQLDEIAQSNGMILTSIDTIANPGGEKVEPFPVEIAANFTGGTFDEFLKILSDIETLVRLADVQSISFSSGSGNYSVMLTTYFVNSSLEVERESNEPPSQLNL